MSGDIRVLVTGATGFLGKHCILALLEAGYFVRGTLRSLAAGDALKRTAAQHLSDPGDLDDRLEFVAADLMQDDGWEAALKGCSHVLHVASPFPMKQPRNRDALVAPARDGTLRVLAAAARAGVKRVVLTSSIVAIVYPTPDRRPGSSFDETHWTNPEREDISPYAASKTIAERAAWDFIRDEAPQLELAVINPGMVFGPPLDEHLSTSLQLITSFAKGRMMAVPRAGYGIADARDVAQMHLLAMTHERAAGERFICANGFYSFKEIGELIAGTCPDLRRARPLFQAHNISVRLVSIFDSAARSITADLGHARYCDNAKARSVLGFSFREPAAALVDAVLRLRELGLI